MTAATFLLRFRTVVSLCAAHPRGGATTRMVDAGFGLDAQRNYLPSGSV